MASNVVSDNFETGTGGVPQLGGTGATTCKAWVNFNGEGTVAIRDSYNVSSITDNGNADYTINFSSAMTNSNYSWSWGVKDGSTLGRGRFMNPQISKILSTTQFQIEFQNDDSNALNEPSYGCVQIFGN